MATPGRLKQIAAQRGESEEVFIPRILHEKKFAFKVARELDVQTYTILRWLRDHGFIYLNGEWVRDNNTQEHPQIA